jgi:hypothetical protein
MITGIIMTALNDLFMMCPTQMFSLFLAKVREKSVEPLNPANHGRLAYLPPLRYAPALLIT